jgi:2-polyprenyl-6-methoxyphenol hydroxylase-like FAD-dependent oxidoreductase
MKVIIVGVGMGGLATASSLAQAGHHELPALEQSPGFRDAGYGISGFVLWCCST